MTTFNIFTNRKHYMALKKCLYDFHFNDCLWTSSFSKSRQLSLKIIWVGQVEFKKPSIQNQQFPRTRNFLKVREFCLKVMRSKSAISRNINFSKYSQSKHEAAKHPTPTLSPSLNPSTSLPTLVITPVISCPGTTGYIVMPQSSLA
ncbi:hypothetical protein MtrunA17_Chr1g0157031 [Medicago truncatula]|uniref:Uncharacterized protein n=1 Tax=Medicago truncatula TaxID=3880 RepID=A0A396JMW3_MEDTR|nr:hypothetical protein MtrunA17_Chr1g0157031 [Medicago truncatula]